jgi:glutamate synthase (NADPH) large chain
MVTLEPVLAEGEQDAKIERDLWHQGLADEVLLRRLIEQHARYTGSARARDMLDNWPQYRARFVKVFPKEYRRALTELAAQNKRIAA